jgi:hypothetical protein
MMRRLDHPVEFTVSAKSADAIAVETGVVEIVRLPEESIVHQAESESAHREAAKRKHRNGMEPDVIAPA